MGYYRRVIISLIIGGASLFILMFNLNGSTSNAYNSLIVNHKASQSFVNKTTSLSHSESYTMFLPIVSKPPGKLYGYVTEYGLPVKDETLSLKHCQEYTYYPIYDAVMCTKDEYFYATTDETGFFQFMDMPTLTISGTANMTQTYFVYWDSDMSYPVRLASWSSRIIDSYTKGDSVNVGNFDIGNVPKISPTSGADVDFPATFQWERRPNVADNNFAVCIVGDHVLPWPYPILSYLCDQPLGNVTEFILPVGVVPANRDFYWAVHVLDQTGGVGTTSYDLIEFRDPNSQ